MSVERLGTSGRHGVDEVSFRKTVDERYLFEAVEKGDVDFVERVLSSEHVEVTQEFGFQYIVYDDKPLKVGSTWFACLQVSV